MPARKDDTCKLALDVPAFEGYLHRPLEDSCPFVEGHFEVGALFEQLQRRRMNPHLSGRSGLHRPPCRARKAVKLGGKEQICLEELRIAALVKHPVAVVVAAANLAVVGRCRIRDMRPARHGVRACLHGAREVERLAVWPDADGSREVVLAGPLQQRKHRVSVAVYRNKGRTGNRLAVCKGPRPLRLSVGRQGLKHYVSVSRRIVSRHLDQTGRVGADKRRRIRTDADLQRLARRQLEAGGRIVQFRRDSPGGVKDDPKCLAGAAGQNAGLDKAVRHRRPTALDGNLLSGQPAVLRRNLVLRRKGDVESALERTHAASLFREKRQRRLDLLSEQRISASRNV